MQESRTHDLPQRHKPQVRLYSPLISILLTLTLLVLQL